MLWYSSVATSLCILLSLSSGRRAEAAQDLPCLDAATGDLINDQFVEKGVCVEDSIWYYDLRPAPITSNGLEAGAPTDLHLWFGSLGNPVEDAFDPENYGLYIEGGEGKMEIDLSPHFLYDRSTNLKAEALLTTELATGPANIMLPDPCSRDIDTPIGENTCAGWISEHEANNKNRIVIYAPDGMFGRRALDVGVKFFHLHPAISTGTPIYHNANGTCDAGDAAATSMTYCRFASDCPNESACVPATEPFQSYVTVTLWDENGDISYKGTRYYTFDPEPAYDIHSSNTKLAGTEDLIEMVDFQRVAPGTECTGTVRPEGENHSAGKPYAPRFFVFAPNLERTAFPQFPVPNLTATLDSPPISGKFFSADEEIGTFRLIQPAGANGEILETNLGYIDDGPGRISGTLMAVPVKAGDVPGKYTVEATIKGGRSAVSNIIVVGTGGGGGSGGGDGDGSSKNGDSSAFGLLFNAWWWSAAATLLTTSFLSAVLV